MAHLSLCAAYGHKHFVLFFPHKLSPTPQSSPQSIEFYTPIEMFMISFYFCLKAVKNVRHLNDSG